MVFPLGYGAHSPYALSVRADSRWTSALSPSGNREVHRAPASGQTGDREQEGLTVLPDWGLLRRAELALEQRGRSRQTGPCLSWGLRQSSPSSLLLLAPPPFRGISPRDTL